MKSINTRLANLDIVVAILGLTQLFEGRGRRTQVNKVLGSLIKYQWSGVVTGNGIEVPCMSWD
jgi:hypothetical protein